jgi:hypothetical protein
MSSIPDFHRSILCTHPLAIGLSFDSLRLSLLLPMALPPYWVLRKKTNPKRNSVTPALSRVNVEIPALFYLEVDVACSESSCITASAAAATSCWPPALVADTGFRRLICFFRLLLVTGRLLVRGLLVFTGSLFFWQVPMMMMTMMMMGS